MRAGQKDQPCNWRAGALSYLIRAGPPDLLEMISLPSRREGSLDIEFNHVASDSINHAYIMKSPPTLWNGSWWNFLVGEHINVPGGPVPPFHGARARNALRPHPVYVFVWLVLICTLYNKTTIMSIAFS